MLVLAALWTKERSLHDEVQIADALGYGEKEHGRSFQRWILGQSLLSIPPFSLLKVTRKKAYGAPISAQWRSSTRDDGGVVRSPDIESLDHETLEHWRGRAKTAKNPMMRARYADLVWDFGKLLGDAKRDYQCALIAIESYLEAAQ